MTIDPKTALVTIAGAASGGLDNATSLGGWAEQAINSTFTRSQGGEAQPIPDFPIVPTIAIAGGAALVFWGERKLGITSPLGAALLALAVAAGVGWVVVAATRREVAQLIGDATPVTPAEDTP